MIPNNIPVVVLWDIYNYSMTKENVWCIYNKRQMSPKLIKHSTPEDRQKINNNLKECWELLKLGLEKKKRLKNSTNSLEND